jgi:hypothetical protein
VLGGGTLQLDQDPVRVMRSSRSKSEPYDEKLVAGLRDALLNALTNASNIRYVGPNESVTVVVQGGEVTESTVKVITNGGSTGTGKSDVKVRKETRKATSKGQSVMTVRVKKSDLDAIAAGRITNPEFRQRATVQAYLRRGDSLRSSR